MDNLTNLLLTMNTMDKFPVEIIEEISTLVLEKNVMKAVMTNDIDTLKSIYYFKRDLIKQDQMKIFFWAIRQKDDHDLLPFFDSIHESLKTTKPRRPKINY